MTPLLLLALLGIGIETPDIDKIQGSWELVEFTYDGVMRQGEGTVFRIQDDLVTSAAPSGVTVRARITLDPAKSPKGFTLQYEALKSGRVLPLMRGIYEIEADTMRWCGTVDPNTMRPKDFQAGKGSRCRLDVFKRKK